MQKTNIATTLFGLLSLVIGIVSFLFLMLFVRYELSYDSFFEKNENIFLLGQTLFDSESGNMEFTTSTSGIVAPTLKKEFPDVVYSIRTKEIESPIIYNQNKFVEKGLYADKDFFKVFSIKLKSGNAETSLHNPYSIVLSESLASKLFGTINPLGKIIKGNEGQVYNVTGVMENIPLNSHLEFTFLISFQTMYSIRNDIDRSWSIMNYNSYIQLSDNVSAGTFEKKMKVIVSKYHDKFSMNRSYFLLPLTEIHFASDINTISMKTINKKNIYTVIFIAFLILSIASINYINLATAQFEKRGKEIAIRKLNGALRLTLMKQFITETYILVLLGMIVSVLVVMLLFPLYNTIAGVIIPMEFIFEWQNFIGLILLLLILGFIAGLYPSIYLSSVRPLSLLNGTSLFQSRRGHLKFLNVLTIFQLGIAIVLVTVALTIQQQLVYIENKNIGYSRDNIVIVHSWNKNNLDNSAAIERELLTNPNVISAAVGNTAPLRMTERNDINVQSENGNLITLPMVSTYFIDNNYLKLFEISIKKGRDLTTLLSANDDKRIIVNVTFVRLAGLNDPIGKKIIKWGKSFEIIGVVNDFHYTSFRDKIEPLMFTYNVSLGELFFIKISERNKDKSLKFINSTFSQFSNDFIFDYTFMDNEYNKLYTDDKNIGRVILYFSIIAVIIAVIGMYSFISFVVRRMSKNIAIRKIMGATTVSVLLKVLTKFFIPVLIAVTMFLPLAKSLSEDWLDDFFYRIDNGTEIMILSVILITCIAFLAVMKQTIKAISANPIDSIRTQ